jgi:predicted restriction endonuclease
MGRGSAKDDRLTKRAQELTSEIWPGKSLEDLVDQHENSKKEQVAEKVILKRPGRRERVALLLERDPAVSKTIKELEDYTCQVCGRRLLNMTNRTPYAETHHIQPLGHDGTDSIDNVLCLCPLCHRLFHLGAVGIDTRLHLYLSSGCQEQLQSILRLNSNRNISPSP